MEIVCLVVGVGLVVEEKDQHRVDKMVCCFGVVTVVLCFL